MESTKQQSNPAFDRVSEIVRRSIRLPNPPATITPEMSLLDDLDLDSPSMVDLMLDLEEEFKLQFSDRETQSAFTVGDLSTLVLRKKAEASSE
jgi:acyl carrier protein